MANGAPTPSWVQITLQAITTVGVPTVFAGVLLYFVLFRLDSAIRSIEKSEDDRTRLITATQEKIVASLDRQNQVFQDMIKQNMDLNKQMWYDVKSQLKPAH